MPVDLVRSLVTSSAHPFIGDMFFRSFCSRPRLRHLLCAILLASATQPSVAQTDDRLVSKTVEGPWSYAFATGEEAQAWVREYATVYAELPALEAGVDADLELVSHEILRIEVRSNPDADHYPFRARAVVQATLRPWSGYDPAGDNLSEDISPYDDRDRSEPDPFSTAAEAQALEDFMDSDVARQAAATMRETTADIFGAEAELVDVLTTLYLKSVAAGDQDTQGKFESYLAQVQKAIDQVRGVEDMIDSMQEGTWKNVETLFGGLLAELDALESDEGFNMLVIANDARYPRARDTLMRAVNTAHATASDSVQAAAFARRMQDALPEDDRLPEGDAETQTSAPEHVTGARVRTVPRDTTSAPRSNSIVVGRDDDPSVNSIDAERVGAPQDEEGVSAPLPPSPHVARAAQAARQAQIETAAKRNLQFDNLIRDAIDDQIARVERAGRPVQVIVAPRGLETPADKRLCDALDAFSAQPAPEQIYPGDNTNYAKWAEQGVCSAANTSGAEHLRDELGLGATCDLLASCLGYLEVIDRTLNGRSHSGIDDRLCHATYPALLYKDDDFSRYGDFLRLADSVDPDLRGQVEEVGRSSSGSDWSAHLRFRQLVTGHLIVRDMLAKFTTAQAQCGPLRNNGSKPSASVNVILGPDGADRSAIRDAVAARYGDMISVTFEEGVGPENETSDLAALVQDAGVALYSESALGELLQERARLFGSDNARPEPATPSVQVPVATASPAPKPTPKPAPQKARSTAPPTARAPAPKPTPAPSSSSANDAKTDELFDTFWD